MGFSEFYANASTGSNMSGGSDENTSPSYTATNGGWNSGTGVFTPTSGDPSASVTVGQFAHVFADGSTTPTFVGRVTAVDSTTVTVSTTAKSGTAPGTAGSGVSINVGGVWKGPNGSVTFPFGFITNTLTDASSNAPRVNFKNNAQYDITATLTHSAKAGPIRFQGYSSTVGDGGRATIDGGTSGASYILLDETSSNIEICDFILQNNGATGSAAGLRIESEDIAFRVVVNSVRGNGIVMNGTGSMIVECEAYACNQSNTASTGGVLFNAAAYALRCISHDNSGSNSVGFNVDGQSTIHNCIADTNGSHGFLVPSLNQVRLVGCEAYNNGGDGVRLSNAGAASFHIESCNLIKNGGYGINGSGAGARGGFVLNCGFGAGTQANTSGTTTGLKSIVESGTVTYAADVTPWTDPANGDFRISLAAAKGAGRGSFTETASSYSGTVGYPDIGAAQHQDSGGGGLLTNPGMGGGMRG